MILRVCEDCGAHLDPQEICDCQGKEKAACRSATSTSSKSGKAPNTTYIISQIKEMVKGELRKIHG